MSGKLHLVDQAVPIRCPPSLGLLGSRRGHVSPVTENLESKLDRSSRLSRRNRTVMAPCLAFGVCMISHFSTGDMTTYIVYNHLLIL